MYMYTHTHAHTHTHTHAHTYTHTNTQVKYGVFPSRRVYRILMNSLLSNKDAKGREINTMHLYPATNLFNPLGPMVA